jgi:hypothetical protein
MKLAVDELSQAAAHFTRLSALGASSHVSHLKALVHANFCEKNLAVARAHLAHDERKAADVARRRAEAEIARAESDRQMREEKERIEAEVCAEFGSD